MLYVNKRRIGGYYEEMAADYLKKCGLHIIEKNYRCRSGEIDIIARDREYLVFVEVKYRTDARNGSATEAVNSCKRKVISKIAKYYMMTHYHTIDLPCRFDVVGITGHKIQWIKNAFDYMG